MGKTHEAQPAQAELLTTDKEDSDDVRNLDRRDNPAQRWLRGSKGETSVRSSSRLAESAAIQAIVLPSEVASVFTLIERARYSYGKGRHK